MDKIKLIIEVDEKIFCKGFEQPLTDEERTTLLQAVGNGKPYDDSGDLISRSALKDKCNELMKFNPTTDRILNLIDNAPTVEYTFEEAFQKTVCENKLYCPARPKGEWVETSDFDEFYGKVYKCTNCNKETLGCGCHNYCPNCGADMRGAEE